MNYPKPGLCKISANEKAPAGRKLCRPDLDSRPVVPKLVRVVTQIKVAIMSYYPQYFAMIAHNTKKHCGFGSALPPEA